MLDKTGDKEKMHSARVVAKKISELLENGRLSNGNPIRPSDIAIILRNAKDRDIRYASALEDYGIPVTISGAKDFFLSPEVLLALCLLNTIDNPRRDIYLAGLLCSPLFDFTADDLYLVRQQRGETLYESLVEYVKCNQGFTKGAYFLEKLDYYRSIAEGVSVDTLIYKLYHETGLLALASRSGGKENLTLLYDYARSYEAGSFKGLYNFISFINSIIDKKTTFDDTRVGDSADAVKIVTCHASKGLEYPVVFLVECDGKIYNKDRNLRLAFSEDFGISFRLRTPSGLAVVNNPVQDIINHRISRKIYEEELRVLYVALTRARERLYIVGICPIQNRDEFDLQMSVIKENLSEYSLRELSSYQEIILACEGNSALDEEQFVGSTLLENGSSNIVVCDDFEDDKPCNDELAELLTERFIFKYPSTILTTLPEKMSVSAMSPTILDGADEEVVSLNVKVDTEEKKPILPAFIVGNEVEESAKRGIATHLFMQFCDLSFLKEKGAETELQRLVEQGFISAEDSRRVRIKEIEKFIKSNLFTEMLSAKKIYRELRFNVNLSASSFTGEEERKTALADEKILVQGVIDCIIERTDGTLALYDYKTDRLTREELSDVALAGAKLREKHRMQLSLYSMAVEKMFGRAPSVLAVYSLPLGDTVDMK
jgi:ATP-dependent helicase/nuclease subunit A